MANLKSILSRAEQIEVPDVEELVAYCSSKLLFRKVKSTERYLSPKEQARLAAMCQHHLDDLTDRKVQLYRLQSQLERLLAEAERLLYKKYKDQLAKMRVSDQKAFIENKVTPIVTRLATIKRAMNILDTYIDNLKQSNWTIARLQEATAAMMRLEKGG